MKLAGNEAAGLASQEGQLAVYEVAADEEKEELEEADHQSSAMCAENLQPPRGCSTGRSVRASTVLPGSQKGAALSENREKN